MDIQDEIRSELRELSPKLEKMEKRNPFRVPGYYFQNLPDKVTMRLKAYPEPFTNRLESWLNNVFDLIFRPRYAIPVSAFLLSLIIGINFFKGADDYEAKVSTRLSDISAEEFRAYALENFDDEELVALSVSIEKPNGLVPDDITNEELYNYFNNNIDNQIYEEDIL